MNNPSAVQSNIEFKRHTLSNGLEFVAECNPDAVSTGLAFFVRTGARDESTELSGVSHFLEHMCFKGTPTRSAEDVNRELDEMGSQSNAFTSQEQTVYFCSVLPEHQLSALNLLSDIMRPTLRESDFDTEKQVILEEIAKYDDQPPYGGHDAALVKHFKSHPLGNSVLGTAASVSALTQPQMLEYFHRQYSASNLTLAMAGNIDFDRIVEQLEVACGDWINHDIKRDINRYSTTPDTADITNIQKDSAHQQYIIQIADGPSATDTDRSAAQLMSTIFGDDNNSRLFWDLIDTGKAEYAVLESQEYQGSGIFLGYLCCPPENQQGLLQRYYQLTSDLHENGVTQQELDTAQAKVCSHIVLRGERPANRMFNVGSNWIQRGIYETTREAIDRIEAVSRQDIQKVLDKYPLSPATTVATGPKTEQH